MAAIYAQRRGTKGGAEDEPQVSAGSVPSVSPFLSPPGPQENRDKLYKAIKGIIETSPQLAEFRAEAKKMGLSLDKLASYLAGIDNNRIDIAISGKDYPSVEERRAFLDRMKGKDSPFIPLMREIKANFKELIPPLGEGEESYLMPRFESEGYAKGGSGLWSDKPTNTFYFELERTVSPDEIDKRITSSDAIMKRLGIEKEEAPALREAVVPPTPPSVTGVSPAWNAASFEAHFRNAITAIKTKLDLISKYSAYDDLATLLMYAYDIGGRIGAINEELLKLPQDKAVDYRKTLSDEISMYADSLPEIYRPAIARQAIGRGGEIYAINPEALQNSIYELTRAVKSLNALDTLLSSKILQTSPSSSDLSAIRGALGAIEGSSRVALNHVLSERYGTGGEGLDGLARELGISRLNGGTAADKYLYVAGLLSSAQGEPYRNAAKSFWDSFDAQFQSSGVASLPAHMAASKTEDVIYPLRGQSSDAELELGAVKTEIGVRNTWDFFSQLAAAKTFSELSYVGEAELRAVAEATKNMPAGTQYVYFQGKEFLENAWKLQFARPQEAEEGQAQGVGGRLIFSTENSTAAFEQALKNANIADELDPAIADRIKQLSEGQSTVVPINGQDHTIELKGGMLNLYGPASGGAGETLRLAMYGNAANFLSDLFAQSPHAFRYANMNALMEKFGTLDLNGNYMTYQKAQNIWGTESGHIGAKYPWDFGMPHFPEDFNSTWPFIDATFRSFSLFENYYQPQVYQFMAPYRTPLDYVFGINQYHARRYRATFPESRVMQVYAYDNFLGLTPEFSDILGQMQNAYRSLLPKDDIAFNLKETDYMLASSGKGNQPGLHGARLDAQFHGRGEHGQSLYGELFGRDERQAGATYKPSQTQGQPGAYDEFTTMRQRQGIAALHASTVDLLNTRIWQALGRLNVTASETERNADGSTPEGYGFKVESLNRDANFHLNSTVPGAKKGAMFVNFFEHGETRLPKKKGTGGMQEEFELYQGDVFINLDGKGTWGRVIFSKDQYEQLMKDKDGKDLPSLQDVVKHTFAEYAQNFGADVRSDVAVEWDRRTYEVSKLKGSNRLGLLMLLQPGINGSIGVAKTTTGDYWVGLVGGPDGHAIAANFYSFNQEQLSALPKISPYGARPGYAQYYYPSYRRNATLPDIGGERANIAQASWLAIDRFRMNIFGGWKTHNYENAGWLWGGQYQNKTMASSLYLSFGPDKELVEGLASTYGRIGRVSLTGYAYRPTYSQYGDVAGAAATVQTNDATDPKKKNYITLFGKYRENPLKNPKLYSRYLPGLQSQIDVFDKSVAGSTALAVMDPVGGPALSLQWLAQAKGIATDMVSNLPWYDLYYNWIATASVGNSGPDFNGKFTYALTTTGNFYYSSLCFKHNFALMGGYFAPTPAKGQEARDPYQWFFAPKWMPSPELAFGVIASKTHDRGIVGTFQSSWEDVFSTSVSYGHDYWRVHLNAGPERYNGIINFAQMKTPSGAFASTTELGFNLQASSSLYLAMAMRNIITHSRPGRVGADGDILAAENLGFSPESFNAQQGIFQMTFLYPHTTVDLTSTVSRSSGRGPWDFFIQARASFRP